MSTTKKTPTQDQLLSGRTQRSLPATLLQLIPYFISCGVIVGTVLAAQWESGRLTAMDRQRFESLSERVKSEVNNRFLRYSYALVGINSTLVDERGVDTSLLLHVVSAREISKELPGTLGIGFIRLNSGSGTQIARDDLNSGALNIEAFEPSAQAGGLSGRDLSTFPERKLAAESALRSGEPRFSQAVPLIESRTNEIGFQLVVPAYRTAAVPASEDARIREGIGLTYIPIAASGLFSGTAESVSDGIDVAVFNGKNTSRETLIFESTRDLSAPSDAHTDVDYSERLFTNWTVLSFGDLSLTFALTTSSHFIESSRLSIWFIAFFGILLATLLFEYCRRQGRSLLGAQEQVQLADRDLNRLSLALEQTSDAVIIADAAGEIEWANAAFLKVSGFSLPEILGKRPGSLLQFEKTDPGTAAQIRAAMSERRPCHHTIQNRSKTGREYWLDLTIQPIQDTAGTFSGYIAVERDVTAQLLQAEALKREKERADLALSGARLGLWDWNVPASEVIYDERWAEMLGEHHSSLTNSSEEWASRVHPEDLPAAYAAIERHFKCETASYEAEMRMRHKDGSWRYIMARGRVSDRAHDGSPLRMVGTHLDLTEKRVAQLELERREQVIEHTSRIAKIGWWEYQTAEDRVIWSKQVRLMHEVSDDFVPSVRTGASFFDGAAREQVEQSLRAAVEHRTPWDLEAQLRTAQGNLVWVRIMGEPVVVDDKVVAVRGSLQDISDQVFT